MKFFRQLDHMDCGPACLKMIAAWYGREYSLEYLRSIACITKKGVSFLGISEAAEKIGMKSQGVKLTHEQLTRGVNLPCILHWNQQHFVVLYKIKKNLAGFLTGKGGHSFVVGDPGHGIVSLSRESFLKGWRGKQPQGFALLLEPAPEFHSREQVQAPVNYGGVKFLLEYIRPYRKYILQIFIGMLLSSILSLSLPFLTQGLVDYGIRQRNIRFIYLVLISQLLLFLGSAAIDMIRNWILLHINIRVSVTIISNFLVKLMKLPMHFFESKNIGDITQRINDHNRIESFLTGTTLSTLFSLVNLLIFSFVLAFYDLQILLVFAVGSMLSVSWIVIFLERRKKLNYTRFQYLRENQNSIYGLIDGMQEIKLNNCERVRRWEWERIQAKLFRLNIKNLSLEQLQEMGAHVLTQIKNILISFLAVMAVIDGHITLGMMLSISYIVGQMNGPLAQLISFVRNIQDARISFERLSEIHNRPNEEEWPATEEGEIRMPAANGILLKNISFQYGTGLSPRVLEDVQLFIPPGKVTAIVGPSGSGKTTLLKLLLKFYAPTNGQIMVGNALLNELSAREWRKLCGTVMQDGHIFSDTVARNIAVDVDMQDIDPERLSQALAIANINEYIDRLPLGILTPIGNTGTGLSGGQRQRILIARAVYKNPQFLFFDEATSALDGNNEKVIMNNLHQFFKGRTVVVIAHRLSTVKNADQIVVLEQGRIVEVGNHDELAIRKGRYYELVKNQLDLEVYEH